MPAFREFEISAIKLLARHVLTREQIELVSSVPEAARYSYTGCGYFLTVSHPALPEQRATLSAPAVVGTAGEITSGFVVFLGNHQLTLECHTWGAIDVPENFRDMAVSISTPPSNVVDARSAGT
jgi:hypothetical protein